jgi:Cu2+-containing amine oxidase
LYEHYSPAFCRRVLQNAARGRCCDCDVGIGAADSRAKSKTSAGRINGTGILDGDGGFVSGGEGRPLPLHKFAHSAPTITNASRFMSMEQPEIWRVINPNVKSPLGYPVSYELMCGENAMSLLVPEDYPQRRAWFTDHQVWVTPYRENERYAAGDDPTQSKPGEGLPAWTKANRPIEDTDIVLWYTVGFHHVPHAEDWPMMPTVWHEFRLKPVNFFARNPALNLPK